MDHGELVASLLRLPHPEPELLRRISRRPMLIESASSLLLADRVTSGVEVTFLALVARQSKRCSLLRGRHESSLEIVC